ncbi:MAG: efflux RND transporter periplasmic adaptor subunit [Desulfobacterales bacterium]|nr:efflux RND transporter periplasmic adaptor subunit [Desulfobacterales bacterium]MDJ0856300.1 efflux RND transporter periplasmic adaptor subunit [Desulfobacterales bacterium]MDJ0886353.1 efflux RND transporter periplasmic adaptor subunit [Desulfobacterales bacterium]MDJ0988604.1 efflux RND transporter periplasmic adaptor subunit [Desulfobacterales bacterium]
MRTKTMISKSAAIIFGAALVVTVIGGPLSSRAETLQGITAPKADIMLSFVVPGRISEVRVKEGDEVEKGQVLVRLYDQPEKIQCEQLKMLSEDQTKILAAKAELAQKKVDLKKVEMARAKGAASDWEVEHLNLDVRIAELALKSSRFEQAQYVRRYRHAESQLALMRLRAPVAGLVEDVSVEAGESIGTLGAVVRLVQNDPLWIDLPVPLDQAVELVKEQDIWVTFPGAAAPVKPNGRIISIATVADAASDTLRVRVELSNPLKRPAGERVEVAFSAPVDGTDKDLAQLEK